MFNLGGCSDDLYRSHVFYNRLGSRRSQIFQFLCFVLCWYMLRPEWRFWYANLHETNAPNPSRRLPGPNTQITKMKSRTVGVSEVLANFLIQTPIKTRRIHHLKWPTSNKEFHWSSTGCVLLCCGAALLSEGSPFITC